VIIATVAAATQVPKIDLRNDPDTLLPGDNRHVLTNKYVARTFGMGNLLVVGLEVTEGDIYQAWFVNKVRDLHGRLERLPAARPGNFLSIAAKKVRYVWGTDDGLDIRRLVPRTGIDVGDPEKADEQLQVLRDGLERNPILRDMLLSKNKKATFIIADFEDGVKEQYLSWVVQVQEIIEEATDPRVKIYVAGEPYFLAKMIAELRGHWYLFVVAALGVFFVLYLESKQFRAAALPVVAGAISVVWTLGVMGLSGYPLTTMMSLTPTLVFAIGIGHSVQVIRRYLEEVSNGSDNLKACEDAIALTIGPAGLAVLTDAVGFLSLAAVDISFYKAYAYFGQFGMFSLLLTCTTFLPVVLSFLGRPRQVVKLTYLQRWEATLGGTLTEIVTSKKKWIPLTATVLLLSVSVYYFPSIERGIDYAGAAFKQGTKVQEDLQELNRLMPGVITFNIPFQGKERGALQDAEVLRMIVHMEDELRNDPNIGYTISFGQYVRLLSKHINDNDDSHWEVPKDPDLVNQYVFLYSLSADPDDFDMVVDYDYTNGQLIGYINTMDPDTIHRMISKIQSLLEYYKSNKDIHKVSIGIETPDDGLLGIGGFAGTIEATREVSNENWLKSPMLTVAMVAVLIALVFRSVTMSFLIILMVLITVLVQYGLAGYFSTVRNWGGNLHFGNLVALSIAMGIAVDYSIYLASRFKTEYAASEDLMASLSRTLSSTGSAVILSVVCLLVSLVPLLVTDLANTWGLGMYIAVAVVLGVFTTVTVLPILMKAVIDIPVTLPQYDNLLNLQVSERTLQLRKEKQELSDAMELLRQTQQQLVESEKLASLGGLVAGVAHEINTPLGISVTATSHLDELIVRIRDKYASGSMKRSDLEHFLEDSDQTVKILFANVKRATELVQGFKMLAIDQVTEDQRKFRVKSYIDEVLLSLYPRIKSARVDVEVSCEEDLEIFSYPGALSQILSNLVVNALAHAFERGKKGNLYIDVRCASAGKESISRFSKKHVKTNAEAARDDFVTVRFRDDGRGMAEAELGKIFEPFFTTKRGQGGSGLGLHIVYNLVTQTLRGRIRCLSQPGKGTEFIIDIPVNCGGWDETKRTGIPKGLQEKREDR